MLNNDLISRTALLAAYDAAHKGPPGGARKLIEEAPAVDATPVVRCKDCMFAYYADNRVPDEQALFCERGGCIGCPLQGSEGMKRDFERYDAEVN